MAERASGVRSGVTSTIRDLPSCRSPPCRASSYGRQRPADPGRGGEHDGADLARPEPRQCLAQRDDRRAARRNERAGHRRPRARAERQDGDVEPERLAARRVSRTCGRPAARRDESGTHSTPRYVVIGPRRSAAAGPPRTASVTEGAGDGTRPQRTHADAARRDDRDAVAAALRSAMTRLRRSGRGDSCPSSRTAPRCQAGRPGAAPADGPLPASHLSASGRNGRPPRRRLRTPAITRRRTTHASSYDADDALRVVVAGGGRRRRSKPSSRCASSPVTGSSR